MKDGIYLTREGRMKKEKTGRTKGADDDKQKRETFSMKISLKRIIDYIRKICV